jgi:hypothetical protein
LDRFQDEASLADVAQALARVALEAAAHQRAQARRDRRRQRVEGDRRHDHGGEDFRDPFSLERPPAGEHFIDDAAERPDVGSPVDRLPLGLLGAHVGGGAQDDAGHRPQRGDRRRHARIAPRLSAARDRVERLRKAEVQHLDLAVGSDLHVRGLEIAVDDPLVVGRLERLGDLPRGIDRVRDRERTAFESP